MRRAEGGGECTDLGAASPALRSGLIELWRRVHGPTPRRLFSGGERGARACVTNLTVEREQEGRGYLARCLAGCDALRRFEGL